MIEIGLNACADLTHGYLLVDSCNFGEFDPEGIEMVRCIPAQLPNAQDLMPCLVEVKKLSPLHLARMVEILRQQAEEEHPFAICGWLDADVDIDKLAQHIARFISGPGPDLKDLLWRYFDPRVFSTIISIYSNSELEALLGPIKKWRFTWFKRFWIVHGGNGEFDELVDFDIAWPSIKQWSTIFQSRAIYWVLKKLKLGSEIKFEALLDFQKTTIAYLYEASSRLNLEHEDDQMEFAYLCTKYGSAYRQHPRLKAGWQALAKGDISWTEQRLQLENAEIERL